MARLPRNQGTTVVDLDEEGSVGSQGTYGKVVPLAAQLRESRPRKAPEDHPTCPHCGAKMHWNQAGATINFECLWRQYSIATNRIDSPNDRLPLFSDEDIAPFGEWVATRKKSRKNPLAYGKMPAANGLASTYAALRTATKAESAEATAKAVAKNGTGKTTKPKKSELVDPLAAKRANRKAKVEEPVVETPAKKRGRPPKHEILETPEIVIQAAPAKKRGRPAKVEEVVVEAPAKKRGRPPKQVATTASVPDFDFDDFDTQDSKPAKNKKGKVKGKGKSKKSK